ncbi:hypothetical protein DFP72DRAFT_1070549 [Ephemerocybe angulata]|uniref:Uncharacterized protein n=1 Tax=Ephemerocybe angulata TaxID=980116 RepID=A0A8H6HS96_9AGAR|nr:hypothetical protein DFP72DRAFT_1070549 [Tulosesus angulatus]
MMNSCQFHHCSTSSGLCSLSTHLENVKIKTIRTQIDIIKLLHPLRRFEALQPASPFVHHDALPLLAWYTNDTIHSGRGYVSDFSLSATSKPYNQHHFL